MIDPDDRLLALALAEELAAVATVRIEYCSGVSKDYVDGVVRSLRATATAKTNSHWDTYIFYYLINDAQHVLRVLHPDT